MAIETIEKKYNLIDLELFFHSDVFLKIKILNKIDFINFKFNPRYDLMTISCGIENDEFKDISEWTFADPMIYNFERFYLAYDYPISFTKNCFENCPFNELNFAQCTQIEQIEKGFCKNSQFVEKIVFPPFFPAETIENEKIFQLKNITITKSLKLVK